jgi:uncharacterized protein
LFIHGGGDTGYEDDAKLAASLQQSLGTAYHVRYPQMPGEPAPDFGWGHKIGREIAAIEEDALLVGHSLGASMLLKYVSENQVTHPIRGIFLMATPFWSGDEDWKQGLKLREDFADTIPEDVAIFLYHAGDDEEVDISHLAIYAEKLPQATIRKPPGGGHQFGEDLTQVARDIQSLE